MSKTPWLWLRLLAAAIIVVFALSYTAAVLAGDIDSQNQLNATHVALLALSGVAAILFVRPDALARIKSLSAAGVAVELVERLQQDLAETKRENAETLRLLAEIFPLLLPPAAYEHLRNLHESNTSGYWGSHPLREDLRLLRHMGLIEMTPPHYHISDVPDNTGIELAHYVRLTSRGRHWVGRGAQLHELAT